MNAGRILSIIAITCVFTMPLQAQTTVPAGGEVCITMTLRDAAGNPRRDWNTTGIPTTLALVYRDDLRLTANTDSSNRAWNADPEGYSWSRILVGGVELTPSAADEWILPAAAFDSLGQARICLQHSRADSNLVIRVTPQSAATAHDLPPCTFLPAAADNFLLDMLLPTDSAFVFAMRPFQLAITARDRYLNPVPDRIVARCSARFPGEFDRQGMAGSIDITRAEFTIMGRTTFLVVPTTARRLPGDERQWIMCYTNSGPSITGRSAAFEVRTHEPAPFATASPPDGAREMINGGALNWPFATFRWQRPMPPDPFTNILYADAAPRMSDTIRYTVFFTDTMVVNSIVSFPSANNGLANEFTLTSLEMYNALTLICPSTYRYWTVQWWVEASDGTYSRPSSKINRPGPRMRGTLLNVWASIPDAVEEEAAPADLTLDQNQPNPFQGTTFIRFGLPAPESVHLVVTDLLGRIVATLIDGEVVGAGVHSREFQAGGLPPGVYLCVLRTAQRTHVRRMILTGA